MVNGSWFPLTETLRPWQGHQDPMETPENPMFDRLCYMCPGNTRVGGELNPQYSGTYVFDNDFAALLPGWERSAINKQDLLIAESEQGMCRVVCYSPRHDLRLSGMPESDIAGIVDVWAEESLRLGKDNRINYVQVFENRGEMMGASNPHPHGQIWATSHLPNEIVKESASQAAYHKSQDRCLLCDYVKLEQGEKERVIFENEHFIVLVPFWAIWPFETIVIVKNHLGSIAELSAIERAGLAHALKALTARYDQLFDVSFPYSMGFHQTPTDALEHPEWHLHAHFLPPLLRSATIRKFMVGYELLAGPQRDITPEVAAERLREMRG